MTANKSTYREIMKATSIFGGVQLFQIIIAVIRSKFIAIILGPTGMGISGLFTSAIGFISGISNFGLETSAVKDISAANNCNDENRITIIISVFRKLVWVTGLLGALLTLIFSQIISQITFGNKTYTLSFIFLSVTLLINQLSSGNIVILRGLRKIAYIAKSSFYGSIIGLITTIPLYYYYGVDGIVPSIIITALASLILTRYFSKKIKFQTVKIGIPLIIAEGKDMLKMGFMISLTGLMTIVTSYIVRIFISNYGSISDVGIYTAGFAILNTYVGMVFSAMATDYYPRLSSLYNNNIECNKAINQQSEIAILILSPILIVFVFLLKFIILLLYSQEFLTVYNMLILATVGIFFKAGSWSIAFVFLAKGESRLFFRNELISNTYTTFFNILGYYFYGLTGLGIAFTLSYLTYLIQVYIISTIKYKFRFHNGLITISTIQFILVVISIILIYSLDSKIKYAISAFIILISIIYSYIELDKRLDIKHLIRSYSKK